MATTHRSELIALLRANEAAFASTLTALRERIRALALSELPADRQPTRAEYDRFKRDVLAAVVAFYLSRSNEQLEPFRLTPDGGVYPLSPFAIYVWTMIKRAVELGVEQQRTILEVGLQRDAETRRQLQRAGISPFAAVLHPAGEQVFGAYRSPLTARRANGRNVIDSIIDAAAETRSKIGALLDDLNAERTTQAEIIRILFTFMTPGALLERYNKPYGRTGIGRAQQIARSTPIFAYSSASRAGAILNPYVDAIEIRRSSPASPPCPICDPMVGIYTVENAPLPGFHANCVCRILFRRVPASQARFRFPLTTKTALSRDFADELLKRL
jgi:hypothetical protein